MLLSTGQAKARDRARKFSQAQLAPFAAPWDRQHGFPTKSLTQRGGLGMLGRLVPPEWDGASVNPVSYALALESPNRKSVDLRKRMILKGKKSLLLPDGGK